MRKYIIAALLLLAPLGLYAGLITHTDYTAGSVITAAAQNTNENAVFNEFNGSITSANIANGTLAFADWDTTTTSSMTAVQNLAVYRRPTMTYAGAAIIDVEANTGTANETCVIFPDSNRRCVTENTAATSVNRRLTITETANTGTTMNSGIKWGLTATANTWYSMYVAKSTSTATDFVIVADVTTPVQANYATLNSAYGTNGWVYIGALPYGDNAGATTTFPSFIMHGNMVAFRNNLASTVRGGRGVRLASTASATTLSWTYAGGTTLSSGQVPAQILIGTLNWAVAGGAADILNTDASAAINFSEQDGGTNIRQFDLPCFPLSAGMKITPSATKAMEIDLVSYVDNILGVGSNPQL